MFLPHWITLMRLLRLNYFCTLLASVINIFTLVLHCLTFYETVGRLEIRSGKFPDVFVFKTCFCSLKYLKNIYKYITSIFILDSGDACTNLLPEFTAWHWGLGYKWSHRPCSEYSTLIGSFSALARLPLVVPSDHFHDIYICV